jgi:PHD/YefM family antitoxin component YafN of YafNO toxin-antitoxin module
MSIVPIKELKDTSKFSAFVEEADEPVFVTKNGYANMVVMSAAYFEREKAKKEIWTKLMEAEEDIREGRVRDAFEVLDEIEEKYEL